MVKIKNIVAREILDSRGTPTIETEYTFIADLAVATNAGQIKAVPCLVPIGYLNITN